MFSAESSVGRYASAIEATNAKPIRLAQIPSLGESGSVPGESVSVFGWMD